jgi:hypothetical protein
MKLNNDGKYAPIKKTNKMKCTIKKICISLVCLIISVPWILICSWVASEFTNLASLGYCFAGCSYDGYIPFSEEELDSICQ